MENRYNIKFLEGKSVESEELVSMILGQSKDENEEIKEFAEKIIDLIFSHSK